MPSRLVTTVFAMVSMNATTSAVQKLVARMPSRPLMISQIRPALMTKPARPSVHTASGSAKRISSGQRSAFATAIQIAAITARNGSWTSSPGRISAAR